VLVVEVRIKAVGGQEGLKGGNQMKVTSPLRNLLASLEALAGAASTFSTSISFESMSIRR